MFKNLSVNANIMLLPWIVLGDFNCIAHFNERTGRAIKLKEILPLRSYMDFCDLQDMKSSGRFFTWSNKRAGEERILSKIDRVLCNDLWVIQ